MVNSAKNDDFSGYPDHGSRDTRKKRLDPGATCSRSGGIFLDREQLGEGQAETSSIPSEEIDRTFQLAFLEQGG